MSASSAFGWRDAVGEALRNIASVAPRSALIFVAATLIFGANFLLSGGEVQRIHHTSASQIANGRFAYLVSQGQTPLNSSECEGLNAIQGVEAAGAILFERQVNLIGGSRTVRMLDVTEGYARAAWPDLTPDQLGFIVPKTLALDLGLRDADTVRLTDAGNPVGQPMLVSRAEQSPSRVPGLEDALIQVSASPQPIKQCLIWASPEDYVSVGAAIRGWLGPDTSLTDFIPGASTLPDPQKQFDQRLSRFGWAVASALILAILILIWVADRHQVALYRLLGMSERHVFVLGLTQMIVFGLLPLQIALVVTLFVLRPDDQLTISVLAEDWARSAALIVIFPLLAWAITPRRATIDVLKGA